MEIQANFLKILLDYASLHNIDGDQLISRSDADGTNFNNLSSTVSAESYIKIFEKVNELLNVKYCGLKMGSYFNLNSLGLVLEISLNTSSFKQGIYILDNYLKSNFPIVSFKMIKGSEFISLQLESILKEGNIKNELLNMVLVVIYRELKLMLPKEINLNVKLPISATEDMDLHFSNKVSNSKTHQIILPKEIEEIEINANKIKEVELLLPKFISMINNQALNQKRFSKKVRSMILNLCNPEIPNFKQVQKQFTYSKRTFQRRLTEEGYSFRKITNEIKKEISSYLSNEKHLKTKDIAYILGYTDASAYLHASKAWRTN